MCQNGIVKRYEFSKVQVGHMVQSVKSGDVDRLRKEAALLREIPKKDRQSALNLLRR